MMRSILCFAWPAEAEPWLEKEHCKLQHQIKHIRYYRGASYDVLITGAGKLNMAAAVAWLEGMLPEEKAWWNIGIAAGSESKMNQWFHITSVSNHTTADTFYPDLLLAPTLPLASLQTWEWPASSTEVAQTTSLIDMEGYAFCKSAQLFASTTKIQLLKWVSDTGKETFDKDNWHKAYAASPSVLLPIILKHQHKLEEISSTYHPHLSRYLQPIAERLKPTFSQQVMLKDALCFAAQYHSEAYIHSLTQNIPFGVKTKEARSQLLNQLIDELRNV